MGGHEAYEEGFLVDVHDVVCRQCNGKCIVAGRRFQSWGHKSLNDLRRCDKYVWSADPAGRGLFPAVEQGDFLWRQRRNRFPWEQDPLCYGDEK